MNDTQRESMATAKTGIAIEVKPGFVRAVIPDYDDFETDWLPVIMYGDTLANKDHAMPSVGAQVALLMDARGEDGFCLGSIYSDADMPTAPNVATRHTTFSDGAVLEYNPETSAFSLTGFKKGALKGDDLNVDVKTTTFSGAVTVNGPLAFTAGMSGSGQVEGSDGSAMTLRGTLTHKDGSIISNNVVLHLHDHQVFTEGANTSKPNT